MRHPKTGKFVKGKKVNQKSLGARVNYPATGINTAPQQVAQKPTNSALTEISVRLQGCIERAVGSHGDLAAFAARLTGNCADEKGEQSNSPPMPGGAFPHINMQLGTLEFLLDRINELTTRLPEVG